MKASIRLRRVYDPPGSADGRLFLVERLWPRGMRKESLALDTWLKDIAPSTALRRWYGHDPQKWSEFRRRYRRELAANQAAWQPLLPQAPKGAQVASVHAGATLSQTLLRIPKESALPEGRHDTDATLVLLEGELTVEAEGKTFQLARGSVLELPKGTIYRGRTKWDKAALGLITLAGPWSRAPE